MVVTAGGIGSVRAAGSHPLCSVDTGIGYLSNIFVRVWVIEDILEVIFGNNGTAMVGENSG